MPFSSYGDLDSRFVSGFDTFFNGVNARLRPDQLGDGELAYSSNGRMGVGGAWQPRKGIELFGNNIALSSSEPVVLPFYLYASVSISSATRSTTTVTITTSTDHNFTTATQVGIAGLTGTVDPNGNRTITVTGATTFTFTIAGASGSETYGGTGTAGSVYLADADRCYGSCLFSDPSDSNSEYIVIATNEKAVAIALDDGTTTDIAYPSGITVGANVHMIQAFSKVFLFRTGATALSWNGSFSGTPAFAKVANGDYNQPTVFTATNNAAATDGVVTISETGHGLSVGAKVRVFDNGSTTLSETQDYVVATVPGANSFTFYASVDDFAATSVVLGVAQSRGRGYTHMPAPAWGAYHQRRLIVPFAYTTSGSSGSETITARNIKDEILFSDVFDSDTYDQLQNQFKVTAGVADYSVYVHPFTEDNAIAFNRNSIHLISGLSGSLADITIREITREAGLVARRSVVTIGSKIFFLSDNGVYATEFGDLYNLRGAGLPLSDPIDPIIKRISTAYASESVGVFHDNRYWLAVPLDGSTRNNAILVYNVLNQKWESVDTVDSTGWDVQNLIPAGAGQVKKLYSVNRFGGIHILENREDDVDRIYPYAGAASTTVPISSYATTRQYHCGMTERKKFNRLTLHLESSDTNASNGTIAIETENVDSSTTLGTVSGFLGSPLAVSEDAEMPVRIGNIRGYGIQMTFTPTQGRPKLRMCRVDAIPAFRALTQAT